MWDAASRPCVLLVIGHTRPMRAGAFDQASIGIDTRDKLISARAVQRLIRNASPRRWTDPKALVFVMACDSGASDLEQLSDVMTSFVTAGAGAVIGTEVKVNTLEVNEFVAIMFAAFEQGLSLGEAMQGFRRARIEQCRPDAFSFNAFGSASARLVF